MSVSVVQGYTCFSGCDEAKARAGKNPHPKPGENEFSDRRIGSANAAALESGRNGIITGRAISPVDAPSGANAIDARSTARVVDIFV